MLHIFDSLTGKKTQFKPIVEGEVRLYVCGMTIYDFCHIGHARLLVAFDCVVRYLRFKGYKVTYVRNITDIDDKIIARANERGVSVDQLTAEFTQEMYQDLAALNVLPPDHEPRATEAIEGMIEMIEHLISQGYAYVGENKNVYYRVRQFADYGKLSNKNIDDLRAGERVTIEQLKDDPLDFVLWKPAKAGEPAWSSPWGEGRPGWHIECSVMSKQCLGAHFDIHGGGMDLKFPHHENEIAQSEAANGCTMANIWMHNGFVNVDNEKMSKSLGNFFTIREVSQHFAPEVIRFFIMGSHYRSPLNYSQDSLESAHQGLRRLYTALRHADQHSSKDVEPDKSWLLRFTKAMDDDFNTAEAIAVLFDLSREVNRTQSQALANELRRLAAVLGLLTADVDAFLKGTTDNDPAFDIEAFVEQRRLAREAKNWAESDRIRDLLLERGIVLEDVDGQTRWRKG